MTERRGYRLPKPGEQRIPSGYHWHKLPCGHRVRKLHDETPPACPHCK